MKRTKKYLAAIKTTGITGTLKDNPERLYQELNRQCFFWNSETGEWEDRSRTVPDPPTDLVRIRVWAAANVVEEVADQVAQNQAPWLELVEDSEPYPCRPPKQLESRVYLTFKRKE